MSLGICPIVLPFTCPVITEKKAFLKKFTKKNDIIIGRLTLNRYFCVSKMKNFYYGQKNLTHSKCLICIPCHGEFRHECPK